jgi:ATP-dependent DNA helicase RecG
MTEIELHKLLLELTALSSENEVVEFKEAKESYDFDKMGKYFSALSNEANLKGHPCAWLVFGVEDKTHRIVGSNYRTDRKRLHSLKKEIGDKTTQNISFIDIYELHEQEGRVLMFQIPAAPKGIPVAFEGFYYGRAHESLVALNIEKIERIRNQTTGYDWSKNIVADATIDDLDEEAIRKARKQFKQKHPFLSDDIDGWDDVTFLNKAKVTLGGKITNTAILLLGKDESASLLSPAIAQISWVLKDAPGGYEHFYTPFILNIDKVLACIRNLRYSYMLNDNSLFPKEVTHYDKWVIREILQNCVAHSNYDMHSRILVLEYNDRLIFRNAGSFIPDSIEEVIRQDRPQDYYRNPFLAAAMVNLNMIETVGNGIKKIFSIQRERLFPLPTYDLSEETHTNVVLYGELIDKDYTNLLSTHPDVPLYDVILLDKIQKNIPLTADETLHLRESNLIAGSGSELQFKKDYPAISYKEYRKQILTLITQNGSATREEIASLIMPTLSPDIPIEKRQRKITNIITKMSAQEKLIRNAATTDRYPVWVLE